MYGGQQRRKLGGLCGRKKVQYYLAIAFVSSLGTLKNELMQISVGPRHNGVFLKKHLRNDFGGSSSMKRTV